MSTEIVSDDPWKDLVRLSRPVHGTDDLDGVVYFRTTYACPVQYQGHADGVAFYFHYRYGTLNVGFGGEPVMSPDWAYTQDVGGMFDGSMETVEAEEWLARAVKAWRERADGQ